jgi:predicted kinase
MLVAMCGIPFAGKSTLAGEVAATGGMACLSVDATAREGGIDLGSDGMRGAGWARAIALTVRQARPLLESDTSVVFDHANHTRRSRDRCRALARETGARFAGVWVDVAPDVAWDRLVRNRQVRARANVPDAAFRQIVDAFEPPLDEPDVVRWRPGMQVDDLLGALGCARPRHPIEGNPGTAPG